MKKKSVVVLTVLCVWVSWLSSMAYASDSDTGKNIYESKCQVCHGSNGDGQGPAAGTLAKVPADFKSPEFWQRMNDNKIADVIENGTGVMPSFDMSSRDVKAVTEYLHHAFGQNSR